MKTFAHKFKDGTVIELTCDMTGVMPKFDCNLNMSLQSQQNNKEYIIWRNHVVLPEIIDSCTDQQLVMMGIYGKGIFDARQQAREGK